MEAYSIQQQPERSFSQLSGKMVLEKVQILGGAQKAPTLLCTLDVSTTYWPVGVNPAIILICIGTWCTAGWRTVYGLV